MIVRAKWFFAISFTSTLIFSPAVVAAGEWDSATIMDDLIPPSVTTTRNVGRAKGVRFGAPSAKEQALIRLTNEERAKEGAAPLTMSPELMAACQKHAVDMAMRKEMAHKFEGESRSAADRAKAEGYHYTRLGENVAAGPGSAERVLDLWMNSDGHRANILNGDFTEIGVGMYNHRVGRFDHWYHCQIFGTR